MTRRVAAVAAGALVALAAPAFAHAAGIARPNPALANVRLDYASPLPSAAGGVGRLEPLDPAVVEQAVRDQDALRYELRDDLGGFQPAPVGGFALLGGGRDVVGAGARRSQIPRFADAATGAVQSFALVGSPSTPPDNGIVPVPPLGAPPSTPPPANGNTPPPPNQGFGGRPGTTTGETEPGTTGEVTTTAPVPPTTTAPGPPTTTIPTTTAPPPTTTTTTATTTPTTTPPATTSTSGGGSGPAPPPVSSCGTTGLTIESDLSGCRIVAVNMAPGEATFEHVTIRNDSDEPVTLSFKATGTPNHLWNDLEMGLWETGTAAPSPLPPLLWWTTQENALTTLNPGESVHYTIELSLPATAGNDDQGWAAVIDFHWHAAA